MSSLYKSFVIISLVVVSPLAAFAATGDQFDAQNSQFYMGIPVRMPISTHLDQNEGRLRVTFLQRERFAASSGLASTSPLTQTGGKFLIDYSGCAETFCANPTYKTMVTELWPGQSTVYLNYKITLNSLNGDAIVTIRHAN